MRKGQDVSDNSTHMHALQFHVSSKKTTVPLSKQLRVTRLSQPSERYSLMRQLCLIFGLGARDAQLFYSSCGVKVLHSRLKMARMEPRSRDSLLSRDCGTRHQSETPATA